MSEDEHPEAGSASALQQAMQFLLRENGEREADALAEHLNSLLLATNALVADRPKLDVLRSTQTLARAALDTSKEEEAAAKVLFKLRKVHCGSGEHPLKRFNTPHPCYSCNSCSRSQPDGAAMFGCRLCDYDLCPSCYQKETRALQGALAKHLESRDAAAAEEAELKQSHSSDCPDEPAYFAPVLVKLMDLLPASLPNVMNLSLALPETKSRAMRTAVMRQCVGAAAMRCMAQLLVGVRLQESDEVEEIAKWLLSPPPLEEQEVAARFGALIVLLDWNHALASQFIKEEKFIWDELQRATSTDVITHGLALLSRIQQEELSLPRREQVMRIFAKHGALDDVCEQAFALLLASTAQAEREDAVDLVREAVKIRF